MKSCQPHQVFPVVWTSLLEQLTQLHVIVLAVLISVRITWTVRCLPFRLPIDSTTTSSR
jgi:hypothetical protein